MITKANLAEEILLNPETETDIEVITICGPGKYREAIDQWANRLTKFGYVVLRPLNNPIDYTTTEAEIENIHRCHEWKIAHSDAILIVDNDGYWGNDTSREIAFAINNCSSVDILFTVAPSQTSIDQLKTIMCNQTEEMIDVRLNNQ